MFSCDGITDSGLSYLSTKKFTSVSFTLCTGISGEGIEKLVSSSSKSLSVLYLCRLRITEDHLLAILPTLPKLKDINLDIYPGITIDVVVMLSRYCCDLKRLYVIQSYESTAINIDAINCLISGCKFIEYLHLKSRSIHIEDYRICILAYKDTLKMIWIPQSGVVDLMGILNECRHKVVILTH